MKRRWSHIPPPSLVSGQLLQPVAACVLLGRQFWLTCTLVCLVCSRLRFSSNEATEFQVREQKTAKLDCPATHVRLRVHGNFINARHNPFAQVSLLLVEFQGTHLAPSVGSVPLTRRHSRTAGHWIQRDESDAFSPRSDADTARGLDSRNASDGDTPTISATGGVAWRDPPHVDFQLSTHDFLRLALVDALQREGESTELPPMPLESAGRVFSEATLYSMAFGETYARLQVSDKPAHRRLALSTLEAHLHNVPVYYRDPLRMFKLCCAALVGSLASVDAGEYTAATRLALAVFDANDDAEDGGGGSGDSTGAGAGAAAGNRDTSAGGGDDDDDDADSSRKAGLAELLGSFERTTASQFGGKGGMVGSHTLKPADPNSPRAANGSAAHTSAKPVVTTFGVDRFRPSDVSRGLKSVVPVIARRSSDTNASIREESAVALRCLCTTHNAALRPACGQLSAYVWCGCGVRAWRGFTLGAMPSRRRKGALADEHTALCNLKLLKDLTVENGVKVRRRGFITMPTHRLQAQCATAMHGAGVIG